MEIFTPPTIKEKRPPGRRSKHSVEYQMMVARKCTEEGMTYREAAKTFNVTHGSVWVFVQKYKHQGAKSKTPVNTVRYTSESNFG
jgi:transposase